MPAPTQGVALQLGRQWKLKVFRFIRAVHRRHVANLSAPGHGCRHLETHGDPIGTHLRHSSALLAEHVGETRMMIISVGR